MTLFKFLMLIIPVLISVAFLTLLERKVLSLVGLRLGPNKVSFLGVLQPIGDALKLSNKQVVSLSNFSFFFFFFSSILMLFSALGLWSCSFSFPLNFHWSIPFLLIMCLLGLNSLNSVMSGWSSFSKFSLIGSIRTVSQLISYESVLYFCIFFFVLFLSGYSFDDLYYFLPIFCAPFCFLIWLPSFLAELNRTPYDFSEGESELVSGFNTEFGSNSFTLIFLAEYSNILFFCTLSALLFFFPFFLFPFFFFLFFVLWSRSVLPRYRFDKLVSLAWKFLIPFATLYFIFFFLISY